MISVDILTVSWIWTETFGELLRVHPKLKSRHGSLASFADYATLFGATRAGASSLAFPWNEKHPSQIQYFWTYYLENQNPNSVSAKDAMMYLVPFCAPKVGIAQGAWFPGYLRLDTFFYPHGIGLVATVTIKCHQPLDEAVELVVTMGRKGVFDVTWGGQAGEPATLSQLAQAALDRIRVDTYGLGAAQGTRSTVPFSVATVVRGSGADANAAVAENSEVHRALEGLCSGRSDWKATTPHPLVTRAIAIRNAPPGHLLYGLSSGRAVWFPSSFQPGTSGLLKPRNSLGCYHRNLVFCSLQTESLGRLLIHAGELIQKAEPLSPEFDRLVRRAAGLIGRMYGGSKSSYASFSPSVQVNDNGWVKAIELVRDSFENMTPLAAIRT